MKTFLNKLISLVIVCVCLAVGLSSFGSADNLVQPAEISLPGSADRLVAAARSQIGVTRYYDPSYQALEFPGGDVPSDRGVCTDVIVRAFRTALQLDLQLLVNQDMKKNFDKYPTIWGLSRPDRNIDHRRVPNLATWMRRQGWELSLPSDTDASAAAAADAAAAAATDDVTVETLETAESAESAESAEIVPGRFHQFKPGDIVTCTVPPNLPHIMIISDQMIVEERTGRGKEIRPLVIHNIGAGTREEDRLKDFPLTGHYRVDL